MPETIWIVSGGFIKLPSLPMMLVLREVQVMCYVVVADYLVCSPWSTSLGRSGHVVSTIVLSHRTAHCMQHCLLRCRLALCNCAHSVLAVHTCSMCWPLVFL